MKNKWQYSLIKNAEAQTNDNTVFKCDLDRDGHITLIDLIISCTNGATSNAGYSNGGTAGSRLEDSIDKIEIIGNGSKTILSVTSVEDLIAEAIRITGRVPTRTISEALSAVQTLYVPIYMGRFPKDTKVMLPNGKYKNGKFWDSLQLQVTYSPSIAVTDFATGTMTFTVGVDKLIDNSPPESKLIKTFKKKYDYTTVASGDKDFPLTTGNDMYLRSIQVYCYEKAIAEAVDFTSLWLKYKPTGQGEIEYGKWAWSLLQMKNAQDYQADSLVFSGRALCSDTDVLQTFVPNPEDWNLHSELYTVTKDLQTQITVESRAGGDLTLAMFSQADAAAAAYTTDQAVYWSVKADRIPRYAYLDMDISRDLSDVMNTGNMTDIVLWATNGGAGATVRINEEHIMPSLKFRGE